MINVILSLSLRSRINTAKNLTFRGQMLRPPSRRGGLRVTVLSSFLSVRYVIESTVVLCVFVILARDAVY